jgi:hypothetical protein
MSNIKTQTENPKGLHQRFYLQKIQQQPNGSVTFEQVDENAEYFVLRLDKNGKDPKHIEACRKAIIAYAVNIEPHLPELAKDLIERYGQ